MCDPVEKNVFKGPCVVTLSKKEGPYISGWIYKTQCLLTSS